MASVDSGIGFMAEMLLHPIQKEIFDGSPRNLSNVIFNQPSNIVEAYLKMQ